MLKYDACFFFFRVRARVCSLLRVENDMSDVAVEVVMFMFAGP